MFGIFSKDVSTPTVRHDFLFLLTCRLPVVALKVPITEPERTLMFNTGFQSSAPMAKNMESAVAALNDNPDFLKDLQEELDGQASTRTFWLGG